MDSQATKILIVDDDVAIRRLFRKILEKSYEVLDVDNGQAAVEMAVDRQPDVVLLDINMPGMNGYETCQVLKSRFAELPPQVLMVSGHSSVKEQGRAFEAGADDYLIKPVDVAVLRSRVDLNLRLRQSQAVTNELQKQVDYHHEELKQSARERMERVIAVQDVTVLALAKVAESRDNETGQHIVRMRDYAHRIASELRNEGPYVDEIDTIFLADLFRSAPLHDIGKVGIPDSVLLKPGRLTPDEFEIMKRHATIGADILNDIVIQSNDAGFLAMASGIAGFHHERWDGQGYPAGLEGLEIPLPARIVSVADVYDALTSERPYKEAWSSTRARDTILNGAGTQFDPFVVEAFERCFDEILDIQASHSNSEPVCRGAMSFLEYDLLETM